MNSNKYKDTDSTRCLIGCLIKNPMLLEQDGTHFFTEEDFDEEMQKVIFGTIYNLYNLGTTEINVQTIENYLKDHPHSQEIYRKHNGSQWITDAAATADEGAFEYYYNRTKKMTLLRQFALNGFDVSDLFPDNLNPKDQGTANDKLNTMSLQEIADHIENKFDYVKATYIDNAETEEAVAVGSVVDDIMEELTKQPDMGVPLYDNFLNAIVRGARNGKLYLRSAPTGVGKSRTLVADACTLACDYIYQNGTWDCLGDKLPSLFIATEQDKQEIITMCLAFISDVNETHILKGTYFPNEKERVDRAVEILKESELYIVELPDFNVRDIENIIKKNLRLHGTQYIFFDYIHTSPKILEETTRRSGGIRLREDTVLFMFANSLKTLCVQYNIFILTSTQLNGDWDKSETPNQNLLRGAKSIADKIDCGLIMLDATKEDYETLESLIQQRGFSFGNDKKLVKMSIYKNRSGEVSQCYLWMIADKGTCRFQGVLVTDYKYQVIEVRPANIRIGDFGGV